MGYWIFYFRGGEWLPDEQRNNAHDAIVRAESVRLQWKRICGLTVPARVFYGAQLVWSSIETAAA